MFETLHKACAMSLGGPTGIAPEGIDSGMPAFGIPARSTERAAANHLRKKSARGDTAIVVASATRHARAASQDLLLVELLVFCYDLCSQQQ